MTNNTETETLLEIKKMLKSLVESQEKIEQATKKLSSQMNEVHADVKRLKK
jgi:uncharacterized protein (UPF0335 family)